MTKLYVAKIVKSTSVDGVGLRNSLYLSGCNLRCKGCHNSKFWELKSGNLMTVDEVYNELMSDDFNVSILGGEPMMQYEGVLELCQRIKANSNKNIWLWTGNELPTIECFYGDILKYIDVLVDGPFIQELKNEDLIYRGSSNQKLWKVYRDNQGHIIDVAEFGI